MKSKLWQQRAVVFLLLLYALDLAWKLVHWRELTGGLKWWGIAVALTVRFAFMGFILSVYLRLRKASQEPSVVTRATRDASVRSMRMIHRILLAAIVMYAFVAERLLRPGANAPALSVEALWILAALMVVTAFGFRRKLLPSATKTLQRDPGDATALGRWQMANILSMVLAVAVSLYGVALRAMGGSRRVAWPFFIASVLLMLLWRPRLDDPLTR